MKSATAKFPSVVAAKKVAVNQLGYYRSMMTSDTQVNKTTKPRVAAAKAKQTPRQMSK